MAALFVAAMREWKRSVEGNIRAMGGIQLRVEKVMDVTISREMEQLDRRLLFLATVGSTAPFIGLFGTVWGIMTSFQAIAASKNTSLAVVAPGIAEALFATALGLLAAIPAVIFYNKFAANSSRLSQRLEAFADEFSAIVSRQIDVRDLNQRRTRAMAASIPTPQRPGGGRRGRARKHTPMHEINVTPFVDVMLVLLIIFMVTAPMLTVRRADRAAGEPRASSCRPTRSPSPSASTRRARSSSRRPRSSSTSSRDKLKAIAKNGVEEQIFIRGDKGIDYGTVMRVMGRVKAAGFTKVSLVTETEGT